MVSTRAVFSLSTAACSVRHLLHSFPTHFPQFEPCVANYLPPSKNPCLDALGYCVKLRLGAEQTPEDVTNGTVSIFDCEKLLLYIKYFCPKASQTNNDEYRVKALKRWFTGIPNKRARLTGNTFVIEMKVCVLLHIIRRFPRNLTVVSSPSAALQSRKLSSALIIGELPVELSSGMRILICNMFGYSQQGGPAAASISVCIFCIYIMYIPVAARPRNALASALEGGEEEAYLHSAPAGRQCVRGQARRCRFLPLGLEIGWQWSKSFLLRCYSRPWFVSLSSFQWRVVRNFRCAL